MTRSRRIWVITGIGAFLISAELLAFRSLNRSLDRLAQGMETLFQRLGVVLNLVSASSKLAPKHAPAQSQNPSACLSYEPAVVELTGTIVRKNFTDAQGRAETYWVLELSRPICVNQDPKEPDLNYVQKDVRLIQLVFLDEKMFVTYKDLLGKKVIVKGTLFAGISAHHHTPVLLTVSTLSMGG